MIFDPAEHKLKPLANDVAVKFYDVANGQSRRSMAPRVDIIDVNAMFSFSKNTKAPVILSTEKNLLNKTEQQTDSGQNVYI